MVDHLGLGLHFVIYCQRTKQMDWAAFAQWYSLTKYLPDAGITIKLRGRLQEESFAWLKKVNLPQSGEKMVETHPFVVAARELDDNMVTAINKGEDFIVPALSDHYLPCVDYGDLEVSGECPFAQAGNLLQKDCYINEFKVYKVWQEADQLYNLLA